MKNKIQKRNISEVNAAVEVSNKKVKKLKKSIDTVNLDEKTNSTKLLQNANDTVLKKFENIKKKKKILKMDKLKPEKPDGDVDKDDIALKSNKISKEMKAKQLKREKRKQLRKEHGQYNVKDNVSIEVLKKRIDEIQSRENLSKTAKRKLRVFKKKLQIAEGTVPYLPPKNTNNESKTTKLTKSQKKKLKQENKPILQQKERKVNIPFKNEEDDEENENLESSNEEDSSGEASPSVKKNESNEMDTSDSNVEKSDEDSEEEKEEDDDEEEDEDDDDDENEDLIKNEVEERKQKNKTVGMMKTSPKKENNKKHSNVENAEKKRRYVLFVGNIPFQSTVDDLKNHFLQKVSQVASVRIPTVKGSKKSRGFAYVEVTNSEDYEKGLSLHNTTLEGFKIKVEYTQTGSKNIKNKQEVVAKNKKLHALRKAGKLAGSNKKNSQRNFRRNLKKTKVQEG